MTYMKKDIIRREFFKLRLKQISYSNCKKQLKEAYGYLVSVRTLKRWQKRFSEDDNWNLRDDSRKPKVINYKVTDEAREKILAMRKKTGWGCKKIKFLLPHLDLSEYSINKILREAKLTRKEHNRGQRAKYVRFQRKHANSLWHIDDSEFGKKGKIITVIDDCSRYCFRNFTHKYSNNQTSNQLSRKSHYKIWHTQTNHNRQRFTLRLKEQAFKI